MTPRVRNEKPLRARLAEAKRSAQSARATAGDLQWSFRSRRGAYPGINWRRARRNVHCQGDDARIASILRGELAEARKGIHRPRGDLATWRTSSSLSSDMVPCPAPPRRIGERRRQRPRPIAKNTTWGDDSHRQAPERWTPSPTSRRWWWRPGLERRSLTASPLMRWRKRSRKKNTKLWRIENTRRTGRRRPTASNLPATRFRRRSGTSWRHEPQQDGFRRRQSGTQ